ncbi:class II aaRS and biotin synthetase, partial [Trichodelitschia bisporula]
STPPKPPADHRELATAQGLFTTSTYSPGSPLLLPNGADMFIKLTSFLRSLYPQFGFREVITPTIYKQSLWERSGHWVNYAEDMFAVRGRGATGSTAGEAGEDEEFGLKPMNCPGHCLLFASEKRSYRDLPVRFADFSPLHRNEISGALSGLTRVRRFHQDDGHIFCRPAQIEAEIKRTMEFIQLVYSDVFDLGPYRLVLSTRPTDNFIGTIAEWDAAEAQLTRALDSTGREWTLNAGDGAFYGPKIDVILRDSDGKEHQTATIQLDFQLPQRFGLSYTAPAPELEAHGAVGPDTDPELLATSGSVTPVIIHRAVLGSLERFLALLIEHYNGRYPLWLSPRPMIFLTVGQSEAELAALQRVVEQVPGNAPFADVGRRGEALLHVETDTSARGLGKKVHEAKAAGYNIIGVVGPRDAVKGTVSLEVGG